MFPVALHSERLELREIEPDDLAWVYKLVTNPDVYRYQSWHPPGGFEEFKQRFAESQNAREAEPRISYPLAVVANGQPIGECGLDIGKERDRRASLYISLSPEGWGQGYGTEAASLVIAFGFEKLNLNRIEARAEPANIASNQMLKKIGMRYEGRLRQCVCSAAGELVDRNVYGLLAGDGRRN